MLHVALRAPPDADIRVGGVNVMPEVHATLDRFLRASPTQVRSGDIRGVAGDNFTDVVNIGIGGSDLGPAMATLALTPYRGGGPRLHFVSNVDGAHLADTLAGLDAERTLFLVASKTFTTSETMTNAALGARLARLPLRRGRRSATISRRSRPTCRRSREFGIQPDRIFGFWDWVGGRYSVWSAIGLPLAIRSAARTFESSWPARARWTSISATRRSTQNMPVIMGLLGVWYRNVLGLPHAGDPALRPAAGALPAPICSSSTWNRTASA